MSAVADASGGRLVDLDSRLKTIDSLRRKVEGRLHATPGADLAEVVAGINDLVRYRMVADSAGYWTTLHAAVAALRSASMQLTAARNTWGTSNYRAVNATFATLEGVQFEVQFHTPKATPPPPRPDRSTRSCGPPPTSAGVASSTGRSG